MTLPRLYLIATPGEAQMRGQSWLETSIWDDQFVFEDSRLIYEVLRQRQSGTASMRVALQQEA
jgi:hypothetical protein